jgi:hypothetical protein
MPVIPATRLHHQFAIVSPALLTLLAVAGCGSPGLNGLAQLPISGLVAQARDSHLPSAPSVQEGLRAVDASRVNGPAVAAASSTFVAAVNSTTVGAAAASPPQAALDAALIARNSSAAVPGKLSPGLSLAGGSSAAAGPATSVSANATSSLPSLPAFQGVGQETAQLAGSSESAARVSSPASHAFIPLAAPPTLGTLTSSHAGVPMGLAVSASSFASQLQAALPVGTLFQENFTAGLSRWRIDSPPGAPVAGSPAAAWSIVDAEGSDVGGAHLALTEQGPLALTQRTFYLQTKKAIDLGTAEQPRLRLVIRNSEAASATFKVVWQSADPAHPEETLIGTRFEATSDIAPREFDLARFKGQAGRLILMAKASQGAVPMIDEVSIYDAAK